MASGGGKEAPHCQQLVWPRKLFVRQRGHATRSWPWFMVATGRPFDMGHWTSDIFLRSYASTAAWWTRLTGTSCARAAAFTSSYSGDAVVSAPRHVPTFIRIGP